MTGNQLHCETVDIYVSGKYLCEALRPHLFKARNGDSL